MYKYAIVFSITLYGIVLVSSQNITCGKNEVYSNCATNCPPTCDQPNHTCNTVCVDGCVCIRGFIRKTYPGPCIPEKDCKQCGPNQVWQVCSDNACRKTCQNRNIVIPCPYVCRPGCSCKKGFVWTADYSKCISVKKCSPCKPNQVWQKCSDFYCRKTCENLNKPIACILICRPGCSCQDGFVWSADFTECIPMDKCVPQCGDNQVWRQCSDNECKRTCENKDKTINCPLICVPGCSCIDGYVWDKHLSQCIPIDSCPIECGPNQIWEECSDNACKRICSNKRDDIICPAICLPGCSCKPEYVWNNRLTGCIPIRSCPNVCAENQVWEECSDNACKKTCENFNTPSACPSICVPGCSCKKGTVWNAKLTECIPIQACFEKCGAHQVWEACSDVLCKKTCKEVNGPEQCPTACIPGCSCEENYVWNEDATECIPINRCNVCDKHQHWRECSDKNCRRTCKNIDDDNLVCDHSCIPGCSCNPGYVWNKIETECILACNCGKNCKENEIWSNCTSACERTCQGPHHGICPTVCIAGCKCKAGYLFDQHQNKCVRVSDCSKKCDDNKEWARHVRPFPVTCQNVLHPQSHSSDVFQEVLYPGCICPSGLILDEVTNECISLEDCLKLLN